jgi:hypothetical protein
MLDIETAQRLPRRLRTEKPSIRPARPEKNYYLSSVICFQASVSSGIMASHRWHLVRWRESHDCMLETFSILWKPKLKIHATIHN